VSLVLVNEFPGGLPNIVDFIKTLARRECIANGRPKQPLQSEPLMAENILEWHSTGVA